MAQRANAPLLWINGFGIRQLCGAEGESDAGNGGNSAGDSGGNNNSNNSGTGNNGSQSGSGQGGSGGGQSATSETVTKAEYEALQARMAQADKNASAAQARVQELEGASKSELEKAQQALADANKKVEDLTSKHQSMFVTNAFLTVQDAPTWHNTSAALKLLDQSLLTVEDDGTVKGMEAAVSKLKKEHPYLIKEAKAGSESDDNKNNNNGGGKPSGAGNNGSGGGGKATDRAEMEKRFPALRGRSTRAS